MSILSSGSFRITLARQRVRSRNGIGPIRLMQLAWSDLSDDTKAYRDWLPTWQNSDASLSSICDDVECICATENERMVGFLTLIRGANTMAQIAVSRNFRTQGIGSALVESALSVTQGQPLRIINYFAEDRGFVGFLSANKAKHSEGQIELLMDF